jgi:hypothetical protein
LPHAARVTIAAKLGEELLPELEDLYGGVISKASIARVKRERQAAELSASMLRETPSTKTTAEWERWKAAQDEPRPDKRPWWLRRKGGRPTAGERQIVRQVPRGRINYVTRAAPEEETVPQPMMFPAGRKYRESRNPPPDPSIAKPLGLRPPCGSDLQRRPRCCFQLNETLALLSAATI